MTAVVGTSFRLLMTVASVEAGCDGELSMSLPYWPTTAQQPTGSVVELRSKRWCVPIGVRLEGPKLEPEGPRAEVGFPTAEQGFSSIQGTVFGFYAI